MRAQKSTEGVEAKHRALIKAFLLVIKKHGDMARYIKKSDLYDQAAREVFLGQKHASRIILNALKYDQLLISEIEKEIKNGCS